MARYQVLLTIIILGFMKVTSIQNNTYKLTDIVLLLCSWLAENRICWKSQSERVANAAKLKVVNFK